MARQEIVKICCDLCRTELPEDTAPLQIGLQGRHWELDLCDEHGGLIVEQISNWVESAREIRNRASQEPSAIKNAPMTDAEKAFLRSEGLPVQKGRRSKRVAEALERFRSQIS